MTRVVRCCLGFSLFAFLFSSAVLCSAAETIKLLAPAGEKAYQKAVSALPKFDAGAVAAKAAAKFPLKKVGDKVSVTVRGKKVSGDFKGMTSSVLRIGSERVPVIDLDSRQLLQFDEKRVLRLRKQYLEAAKLVYDEKQLEEKGRLERDLYPKYPAPNYETLADIFGGIKNKAKASTLLAELLSLYDSSLPIPDGTSRADFSHGVFQKFLGKHPELVLADRKLHLKAAFADQEKELRETRRAADRRRQLRLLEPTTATPVFKPDTLYFRSGMEIAMTCPTSDAAIHYTVDGSEPTTASPRYSAPVKLQGRQSVKAKAFHPVFGDSDTMLSAPWLDTGLLAYYFKKMNFTGSTMESIVPTLNDSWGDRAPDGWQSDFFSAIYVGYLAVQESGEYTLILSGPDAFRMWLGTDLVIDSWEEGPARSIAVKKKLVAGERYSLKVCYAHCTGEAGIRLEWIPPQGLRQLIPSDCLGRTGLYVEEMQVWCERAGRGYKNRLTAKNPGIKGDSLLFNKQPELRASYLRH